MKHFINYVNLGRQCQIILPLIILLFSFLNVSAQAHFDSDVVADQLVEKALSGDAKAQHNLAIKYLNERNYDKAFYWEQKSAEQGIARAQCNLGLMYEEGWGTDVDESTAISWYLKAIENGSSDAYFNIASLYMKKHNYEIAVPYLKIISEKGDVDAQSMLGVCYSYIGDYESSIYWRNKAVEGGSISALHNYGIAYMRGFLGVVDYEKAIYWFERASERGHKLAPHNLSLAHYEAGKKAYDNNEWTIAFKHFLFAGTSEKNPISDAMRMLSACYRYGRGTGIDINLASSWMQKAADNNNPQALELLGESK